MTKVVLPNGEFSDDGTAARDMRNYGYMEHLLALAQGQLMVAAQVVADRNAAAGSAGAAAGSAGQSSTSAATAGIKALAAAEDAIRAKAEADRAERAAGVVDPKVIADIVGLPEALAEKAVYPALTGRGGKALMVHRDESGVFWGDAMAMTRIDVSANLTLLPEHVGRLLRDTSTNGIAIAAPTGTEYTALPDGFFCYVWGRANKNASVFSTLTTGAGGISTRIYSGELRLLYKPITGTALESVVLIGFSVEYTTSGTFVAPLGYSEIEAVIIGATGGAGGGSTSFYDGGIEQYRAGVGGGSSASAIMIRQIFKAAQMVSASCVIVIGVGGVGGTAPTAPTVGGVTSLTVGTAIPLSVASSAIGGNGGGRGENALGTSASAAANASSIYLGLNAVGPTGWGIYGVAGKAGAGYFPGTSVAKGGDGVNPFGPPPLGGAAFAATTPGMPGADAPNAGSGASGGGGGPGTHPTNATVLGGKGGNGAAGQVNLRGYP